MGQAAGQAIIAGLGTLMLIALILFIKGLSIGVNKVKEVKKDYDNEIDKISNVVELISSIDISPPEGKVEHINFYLNKENEHYFYNIPPEKLYHLKRKLEQLIKKVTATVDTSVSYGHAYVVRRFIIGDEVIMQWHNDKKI